MVKFVICNMSVSVLQTLDVHRRLNCCTEIILESFEQIKTIGSCKKGILYGVPVSVKENILLKVKYSLFYYMSPICQIIVL